ncbi:MAG TPA: bifunctional diaminohydroxyphosphoribosylaminopyrimidine deaminase/5-amino-6-(5-phosphoribosylamino)uracil reductase RibD [Actinomycetota bacterium]
MRRALLLAERGWGRVSPNPMVGALVVDDRDGEVLGEGWHEGPGTMHAEVMALRRAGDRARGSTVVCTLEPCHRVGRTPPCTLALIEAGVAKVVVAATDPNMGDDAPGLSDLRAAGIDVEAGVLEPEARRLNGAFERHVTTGLPTVTLKMASSLDGKSAARDGSSKWITGMEARDDVQRSRAWADAIVVGAGTVIADDPALTVRDVRFSDARPPLRVVVDSAGRVPPRGSLFDGSAPTLIATTSNAPEARVAGWVGAGAEVVVLDRDVEGGVSLPSLLAALGKRDVQGVLLEGGPTLAWSFVRDGLVDDVVLYVAPKVVGGATAPGVLMGEGFAPITDALDLTFESATMVGSDLRLEAHVHRDH